MAGPIRFGVAPIAWTNNDLPQLGGETTLETCLRETRKAGFSGTETGVKFPMDATVLAPILQKHKLAAVSGWFSGELLKSCVEIVSGVEHKTGEVDIPQTGLTCWYYMSAIQNMSVLETPDGVRLLGVCAPPETTLMGYVHVFVAQARKRKAQSENAAAFAVAILSESFPCSARTQSR